MSRRIVAALLIMGSLAGCATVAPDYTGAFIAQTRGEARALEAKGALADARLHWRYVTALSPNDAEANAEIQRLTGVIRERRDALVRQGDAAMKTNRTAQARTFYLKALALDGTDVRARNGLAEMDLRAMLANQDKKDQKDQKAMSEYKAQVHDAQSQGDSSVQARAPAGNTPTAQAPDAAPPDLGPPSYDVLKR